MTPFKPATFLFAALVMVSASLAADDAKEKQESAAEKKTQADAEKKASKDPLAEWKELNAKKLAISKRLEKLKVDFEAADRAGKLKIRKEYQQSIAEFNSAILPRMNELASKVYAGDPTQSEAGEFVLEQAYSENRYADVVSTSDKLLAAGHKVATVVNLAAASHFALHHFEKSSQILAAAEKDGLLDQRGGQYVQASKEYVELWKKEKKIRAAEEKATGDKKNPRVELKTNKGKVLIELFENEAPNTVANFINLIESKTYNGTKFHRVIPSFMIQGGDPDTREGSSNKRTGGPGYTIDCECYREDARKHFRGSLSMAHAGRDSGGSQFFITHLPTPHLNAEPNPGSVHTVFGRVIDGMKFVEGIQVGDEIVSAVVLRKRNHEYKPKVNRR